MYRKLKTLVEKGLVKQVPAVGLGAFRIGFSLVILQEIVFLFYFRHLIFDPVPFFDRASPILHFFLLVWAAIAVCLVLGVKFRKIMNLLAKKMGMRHLPVFKSLNRGEMA